MEITILDKKENPLLNRIEINFEAEYQGEETPSILDVKHKLVAIESSSKNLLVVDSMKPSYGVGKAVGLAKIYDSEDKLKEIETKAVINKNEEPEEEVPEEETPAEDEASEEDATEEE